MSAMTDIVVNDGQTVPVSHTFKPAEAKDGVFTYEDRSGGVPAGYPRIKLSLRRPVRQTKRNADGGVLKYTPLYRAMMTIELPVMEALSVSDSGFIPAPTQAYQLVFKGEFLIPARSNLVQRQTLLGLAGNMMIPTLTTAYASMVKDLEAVY